MGQLLVTFSLLGLLIGTIAGALAAWRHWPMLPAFVVALLVDLAALWAPEFGTMLDFGDLVSAVVIAPLLAVLPTAAGFVAGRRLPKLLSRE